MQLYSLLLFHHKGESVEQTLTKQLAASSTRGSLFLSLMLV